MKTMLKDTIEKHYKKSTNKIFEHTSLNELDKKELEILNSFHMNELYLVEADNDYFCGIRANHFCVEYGFSEDYQIETNKNSEEYSPTKLILITANHKGIRVMTLFSLDY